MNCSDDVVRGIEHVELDGTPLRATAECIWPQIATPDGLEVDHYQLLDVRMEDGAVTLQTRPWWRTSHRMEWQEHGGHQRINTASWSNGSWPGKDQSLTWIIRPCTEVLGGRTYRGFSYGFIWNAPGAAIYQIEDKATWEIGGGAKGNTWIMRSGFSAPVKKLGDAEIFSSGWTLPGLTNPYIFQHLPLYTGMSGFTFQHTERLALVTSHTRPSHVRALFQEDRSRDLLLHFNQFVFDLTEQIDLPARRILAAPIESDSTTVANHYLAVRDQLQQDVRAHYGIERQHARPAGTLECWDLAQLDRFPQALQWLNDHGLRQIFVMPLWRSNETDVKRVLCAKAGGPERWGVLGNMCCVLEPEIADEYGGWTALHDAFEPASRLGLECYIWYSNCFSSLSPLGERIPDLFAHDQSGQGSRNNYGHVLFAVNNRSDGHLELFKRTMKKLQAAGFRGVFRDSHFNMGTDTIDYRAGGDRSKGSATPDQVDVHHAKGNLIPPTIYSMHDAEFEQLRFCQNELDWLYIVESPGMVGLPRCGLSLQHVRQHEWLFDDMSSTLLLSALRRVGIDATDAYFRGMANRLFYTVAVDPNVWPDPNGLSDWCDAPAIKRMNEAFLAVESDMKQRRVLPDDHGIAWSSPDGTEVVFAYQEFEHMAQDGASIEDMQTHALSTSGGTLTCHRHGIYRIRSQHR